MMKPRTFQWTYIGLWLIRVFFALYGTGYIHPDEHMQSGEVTAATILKLHAFITWDWQPEIPVRSVIPTFATSGLPLLVMKLFFGPERSAQMLHPSLVFRIPRLVFLCLTSILDYSILSLVSQSASRRLALLLLASSYVTWVFQVRPFANLLESVLLALCLMVFRRIVDELARPKVGRERADFRVFRATYTLKRDLHLLGALAAIAVFTHPTFLALGLPIACQLLLLSYQATGSSVQVVDLLLLPSCTAMAAACVFVAADTYYYHGNFSKLVITPYNYVTYNLTVGNLVDHGLHPHWLHVGVNLPMFLGPLLAWVTWASAREYLNPSQRRIQKGHFQTDVLKQTLIQCIILSLAALSIPPHQEPRLLAPLILPIIVLTVTAGLPRPGKFFWVFWITFNIVLALVFGVFHQAGVVPSLISLHSTLRNTTPGINTHIIYWKTYMPPRHLLGVPQQDVTSGKLSFVDLAGAPQNELMAALSMPSFSSTYLVTPVPMYLTLPQGMSSCMTLTERIFPHLDLDHIPESIHAGGRDALSLGIYAVERDCLVAGLATSEAL